MCYDTKIRKLFYFSNQYAIKKIRRFNIFRRKRNKNHQRGVITIYKNSSL